MRKCPGIKELYLPNYTLYVPPCIRCNLAVQSFWGWPLLHHREQGPPCLPSYPQSNAGGMNRERKRERDRYTEGSVVKQGTCRGFYLGVGKISGEKIIAVYTPPPSPL